MFFFSSRRRHTRCSRDWSSDVCSSDLAFYAYAHVPWIKPSQRRFTEADLPAGDAKRALYERGREILERAGYREIGMDHRSEERRVGKEGRSGGAPDQSRINEKSSRVAT